MKIFHILGAALFVTSFAYCVYLWRQDINSAVVAIQTQTWLVMIPFALFQLATGFTMISLKHYELSQWWIKGSVLGFVIAVASWFGFIYLLIGQRQIPPFEKEGLGGISALLLQTTMLLICTLSLLTMIFLMANKI